MVARSQRHYWHAPRKLFTVSWGKVNVLSTTCSHAFFTPLSGFPCATHFFTHSMQPLSFATTITAPVYGIAFSPHAIDFRVPLEYTYPRLGTHTISGHSKEQKCPLSALPKVSLLMLIPLGLGRATSGFFHISTVKVPVLAGCSCITVNVCMICQ